MYRYFKIITAILIFSCLLPSICFATSSIYVWSSESTPLNDTSKISNDKTSVATSASANSSLNLDLR